MGSLHSKLRSSRHRQRSTSIRHIASNKASNSHTATAGEKAMPETDSSTDGGTHATATATATASRQQQQEQQQQQQLQGKVYAITGGASGIGYATAKILSKKGATVCLADVDPQAMKEAEQYFSRADVPFMITKVDISKRSEVDEWVHAIVQKFGKLHGAANVAGVIGKVHGITDVADMIDEEWNRIIGVNLTGTMYCMRAELNNIHNGGSIVNVSSIHGLKGFAKHAAYDASKHGMVGLTKAAALENGHREVRVNSVAPGAIYTPLMQKNWDESGRPKDAPFDEPTAFQRQGTAEETANVIVFLLGPESTFVSGSVYQVDGAWI